MGEKDKGVNTNILTTTTKKLTVACASALRGQHLYRKPTQVRMFLVFLSVCIHVGAMLRVACVCGECSCVHLHTKSP